MADPNLSLWYRFAKNRNLSAAGGLGPTLGIVRASDATYFDRNGILQIAPAGVARFDYDPITKGSLGLFVEETRANVGLWGRDLTDAVWAKTTITPLKDQVGEDGVANSASSILATADNSTILQGITLVSAPKTQSFSLKRLVGSGNVDITIDNGATWTTVSINLFTWTRVDVTQTLADPVIGIRLVVDTDKVAVDFSQLEDNASFPTSRIATLGSIVTRNADIISTTDLGWLNESTGTFYVDASKQVDTGSQFEQLYAMAIGISLDDRHFVQRGDTDITSYRLRASGPETVTLNSPAVWGAGVRSRTVNAYAANDAELYVDGSRVGTGDQSLTLPTGLNILKVGYDGDSINLWNGHFKELRYYNVRKNNQFLEDLSNGLISEESNLVDARFDALKVLVPTAPPYVNDMLFAWLLTEGGTGNSLTDRWYTMLINKAGVDPGTINDMWFQLLGINGHTQNSLNDRELAFWTSGGALI